jgi:hypothetical protein
MALDSVDTKKAEKAKNTDRAKSLEKLKGYIDQARKAPLNFAICLGKGPDDLAFLMSKTKGPSNLAKAAKQMSSGSKISAGTVTASGKVLSVNCEEDPPVGLA